MKLVHIAGALAIAILAAGCADSVSKPVATQALSEEDYNQLQISDVTADAARGVAMSDADFGIICQKVKAYINAQTPGVLVDANGHPAALKMRIHFTRFDRGNAFARAMLMGLGQIHIEGTVSLIDSS